MKQLFTLIAGILLIINVSAQDNSRNLESANQQLDSRGEVYFQFNLEDRQDIGLISRMISVDKITGNQVIAYANKKEFQKFLEYTSEFETLLPPSLSVYAEMSDDPKQVLDWNYYPTYTAYETIMSDFAANNPDICRLITITTLSSGRKIQALKITDNPDIQENEPEFLYTSSIHGDETTGYILMLHLIDYLLTNYTTDPRITEMINNTEIYINPLANPDGTYKGGNGSVNGATRGNANNVDLNRNYADPAAGPHPDGNPWQPETIAFMNFAGFHHFVMSANFHGGAEVLNYPWDTWSRLAADNDWWVHVCREYADTVHAHAPSNYLRDFDNGITNGYAWYTITGGRQDYMNFFRNCREVTMEISNTKLLPANQLINHWNYNYRSLLNYIEQCNYGLHGVVSDSITGAPLNARVFISGHDQDSSHVFTDPTVGDYHRLLKAGQYNVTFSAAGHYPKTITVQITDFQKLDLNVQLYDGKLHTNFTSDVNYVQIGSSVHFQDQSAGSPDSWRWEFEGGTPSSSIDQNPAIVYNEIGNFNVKLVISRTGSNDSLVKEGYISVKEGLNIGNQSATICDALFFDSGGASTAYSNNESTVMTISPTGQNNKLKASFIRFNLEDSQDCLNDWLKVYDGTTTSSALIGTYCGNQLPADIQSTNILGALTFEFHSNNEITAEGWTILLECDSNVGIEEKTTTNIKVYPNPVTDGFFEVQANNPIENITMFDAQGRRVSYSEPNHNIVRVSTKVSNGIYVLKIRIQGKEYSQKIIISQPQ
ncbi:MAG: T9SS type A sorting domain-containing protein [Bacteroidales bacterium]|nr:T9SS type A sorting domain-containing protein [Bacteroidales bacterium]